MSKKPDAKPPYDDETPKKKRGGVISWVLLAMLVAGLSGFGIDNYGGQITSVGKVGDREIAVDAYARTLRGQINQIQRQFGMTLPFEQVQALGIDRQALEQVVTATALAGEAHAMGLSAGDVSVASEIAARPDFQGVSGGFDKDSYRATLEQNGLTVTEFETTVREDIARSLLQGAVIGGVMAPASAVDTLHKWQGETRELAFLPLAEADLLQPLTPPDAAAVQAWYDKNIATYTRPEAKRIRYVALTPEVAGKGITLDEADVRALYDERIDQFVVPEKRLVERLIYPDDAAAAEAKARLDAGTSFEALVAERKLELTDIDMGDVSKAELGAAGDAVFALSEPGVVGPLPSDLGPALFRMNAVLAAQDTSFETVKASLEAELLAADGIKAVGDRVEAIDDLLAGGGALEDMASDLGQKVETTDYAKGANDNIALAANPAFQKSAEALEKDSFLEAVVLEDGSLIAMEFVETVPATPRPLDQIRDQVTADAKAQALTEELAARAETVRAEVEAGKVLSDFGAVQTGTISRDQSLPGLAAGLTAKGFAMAAGETFVWSEGGLTGLLQLNTITAAPVIGGTADVAKTALADEYRASIASDLFTLYSKALTDKAGLQLDQTAINAVHTQLMQN
jgi:peptidyl-prolyl cis-trans isomerase D